MSREKQSMQNKKKEQVQKYDLKKNRISFKQFQQCYQQHVQTQKQKKKSQQQSLNKLSSKNTKQLQLQQLNKENQPYQLNQQQQKIFFNNNQHNSKEPIPQLFSIQIQPITFNNRTVNIKSCFTSPKATSLNVMKSINLASNKSKQMLLPVGNRHPSQKSIKKTNNNVQKNYGQSKRTNVSINLNVKPTNNGQNHGLKKMSKDETLQQQIITKFQSMNQIQLSKNSSLSHMNTIDPFEGSLTSLGSQKILKYQNPQFSQTTNFITQQVTYLAAQLQFLNQFFKEIQPSKQQNSKDSDGSNLTYKIKLLSQIKVKLNKYEQTSVDEKNPLKQLFKNIIQLLTNYETDLKKLSSLFINHPQPKGKGLQIVIDDSKTIDYENRFKRQDSKKKIVKLSKSRRTNQQTLYTESIIHPFQPSQFSLLNTSKITDISRPSSQNKDKSGYYNEIENIINSKILDQSVDKKNEIVKANNNMFKQQSQSKTKVLIKGSNKTINNPANNSKSVGIKEKQNIKGDCPSQQIETKNKVKSVTKTINLITKSKPQIDEISNQNKQNQINPTQKLKSITMKDILQKNKQKNILNQQEFFKKTEIPTNLIIKNNYFTDIRQSIGSHNDSIFQLQYLENYSSQNHNFTSLNQQTFNPYNKLTIQTGNNINWKQNKYSNKLFI